MCIGFDGFYSFKFHQSLLQRMNEKIAGDRLVCAKQFVSALTNGEAQSIFTVKA